MRLQVGLSPEKLGQGTTIKFGFQIARAGGGVPSPVTRLQLLYPEGFGLLTSGLGLASCTAAILQELGSDGCPSRSRMGYGTARAEVPIGGSPVSELATTGIFMAPLSEGNINIEFFVYGYTPLDAELIFPGVLLHADSPYGGDLSISVPLLEVGREGPYVSLIGVSSTIGPLGITYWERIHGRFVPSRPSGIILPLRCPARGFPFAVVVDFADGTSATGRDLVPCPASQRPHARRP